MKKNPKKRNKISKGYENQLKNNNSVYIEMVVVNVNSTCFGNLQFKLVCLSSQRGR